jgi:hypothetical protein
MKTNNKTILLLLLCLSLCTMAQGSHWTVNIYDYQYDMTSYLLLRHNGEPITNYEDYELAAFVGDECRGVAEFQTVTLVDNTKRTYGYLRIRSNLAGEETVSFMGYQKSTGKVIKALETLTFKAMGLQGLPSNPFIINIYDEIEDEYGNVYVYNSSNSVDLKKVAFDDAEDHGVISIPATVDEKLTVTGIADDAFADVDKSKVNVIDFSATAVTGITADRSVGIFRGFDESTLICLPEGVNNQAAEGAKNIVIGGVCADLLISERKDFNTIVAFKAKHATFDRTFASGKTATVYLPFSIPNAEANKLGTFHTFKGITDEGTAEFNSAETGDVQANVPYIFIPKETIEKIDVTDESGNISVPVTGSTAGVNGSLVGTTTAIIWDEENAPINVYGFAAEDKGNVIVGAFVKAAIGASIARYRAYMVINVAEARNSYPVAIDKDQVSGITDLDVQEHAIKNEYFDMRGIRQKGVPVKKSVYIVNGHKVVIK